jgi:hypothetical protein
MDERHPRADVAAMLLSMHALLKALLRLTRTQCPTGATPMRHRSIAFYGCGTIAKSEMDGVWINTNLLFFRVDLFIAASDKH